jgi:hypothetical protein
MKIKVTETARWQLRAMLARQAQTAYRKAEWRRRRDVKHRWPKNAEGRTA